MGASGVLVNCAVAGGELETLLDAGTIMGTEVMVEVHSPNELDYALSRGATLFLVNMWDRITGTLYPNQVCIYRSYQKVLTNDCSCCLQAKLMASMLPINSCAAVAGNIHTLRQVSSSIAVYS
jgi:hypothetical protein